MRPPRQPDQGIAPLRPDQITHLAGGDGKPDPGATSQRVPDRLIGAHATSFDQNILHPTQPGQRLALRRLDDVIDLTGDDDEPYPQQGSQREYPHRFTSSPSSFGLPRVASGAVPKRTIKFSSWQMPQIEYTAANAGRFDSSAFVKLRDEHNDESER